ncbi:NAD(P)/FAD-dependent oxidoreductase [Pigmentiphaga soli]|uniref:NAD(P)/FAD-dependent oxidoreductase n=1 Tax=Pigmentiphaga soli TaxID=1007095 RepID=A0ABP8GVA1_9BURK
MNASEHGRRFHAEIAGGGIGGLATAAALARIGWSVRVHERQPRIQTIGAGIYIWENGLQVLDALGCLDQVIRDTHRGFAFEIRDSDGHIVDPGVLPPDKRTFTVPRIRLLHALRDAASAAGAELVVNSEAIRAEPEGILHLQSGASLKADLVVGADGVRSPIREGLGLAAVNRRTEEGSVRLIVNIRPGDFDPADHGKYIEQWAGERRFLITPINDEEVYLAFSALESDPGRHLPLDKATWKKSFPMWAHLIDRVTDDLGHWDRYSVIHLQSWSRGHVALLGDSAHAQPPNLGQGAGMAMQNALALAAMLRPVISRDRIPDALQAWEMSERPLVEHCQKWSELYGEVISMPEAQRRATFRAAATNEWIRAQIFRAAHHHPLGAPAPAEHAM